MFRDSITSTFHIGNLTFGTSQEVTSMTDTHIHTDIYSYIYTYTMHTYVTYTEKHQAEHNAEANNSLFAVGTDLSK